MNRSCDECAILKVMGECPIFHSDMSGECGCPYFAESITECDICGKHIVKDAVIELENNKAHIICHHCAQLPMCATCHMRMSCAFEQDSSCQLPKYILVQEHPQPHMTIQKQIQNPERIAETCAKKCPCYWEPGLVDGMHCTRALPNSGCENYKTAWRN